MTRAQLLYGHCMNLAEKMMRLADDSNILMSESQLLSLSLLERG